MQRASDRWISIVLSVLLHGALLAALVWGWLLFRRPPRPAPTLAIEAQVVDARTLRGSLQPQPPPVPQPEPQESLGPPQPTAEQLAQRDEQRRQAEEAAAAAEKEAAEKEAAEKQAAEEQAAREADARRQAEAAAAAAQKRAAEQQRLKETQDEKEREEDLQRSLAAERETDAAVRSGPALANWEAQIKAKITQAWLRPPTARPGIECMLYVTQVPGGEVAQVTIGDCNGDQAVRDSIEAAVYRASPLPPPPDPALFDRNLKIDFKPD